MTVFVRPFLRIVANGKDDKGNLRFTLICTPEHQKGFTAKDGAFEFANWPSEMAKRLAKGELPFAELGINMDVRVIGPTASTIGPIKLTASASKAFENTQDWAVIDRIWQAAFSKDGKADGWRALAEDITTSLKTGKRTAALKEAYGTTVEGKLDRDGALISKPLDASTTVQIDGVVPVRQGDLAVEEETFRAARVLAKQFRGPFAVLDDTETARQDDPKARLDAVIDQTDPERKRSKKTFSDIQKVVNDGQKIVKPDAKDLPSVADIVPQAGAVMGISVDGETSPGDVQALKDRESRKATHRYGTWLQRRDRQPVLDKDNPTKEKPVVLGPEADRQKTATSLEWMQPIYFALQGDPSLARLFCLVIDFHVVPTALSADKEKVHLSIRPVWPEQSEAIKTVVVTAAARSSQGYWPISTFDAGVCKAPEAASASLICLPDLVEQEHGIWKLGEKLDVRDSNCKAQTVPRFELSSLDIRRSMDSKTEGRDRGESQKSGGFTILDRGRGDQIARDLALSSWQAGMVKTGNEVVLHAEELTVGRRVDVAAAAAGTAIDQLDWRSLFRRYVDFDFADDDKVAETIFRKLLPDADPNSKPKSDSTKGLLEEISFQLAARFMPSAAEGEGGSRFEVVAEEAIYSWDGTPAAVLTDASSTTVDRASNLPFGKQLDLPGAETAKLKLRPPPLRFGVPYVFRFRSTFLGGGSRDAKSAVDKANAMVPAAMGTEAMPRRFLRHESIMSPVMLLPYEIAKKALGDMGYEKVDQAIVRSVNGEPADPGQGDENIIRGTYVSPRSRARPDETVRLLVPPEASVELVARHSKLDQGDPVETLRGGMLDVAYTPAPPVQLSSISGRQKGSGFPVAVESRRDSLDANGVIYRKTVSAAENSDSSGVPVFMAGGTNQTARGQVGYLPDPAVQNYSVRARIRGSDNYLQGDMKIPIYGTAGYPHVLPLAIKVSKNSKRKVSHPDRIGEIATHISSMVMKDDGSIRDPSPTKKGAAPTGKSTKIQVLELALLPGEDFDLEIACLPDASMLVSRFALTENIAIQLAVASSDPTSLARLKAMCGDQIADLCPKSPDFQKLSGLQGRPVPSVTLLNTVADTLLHTISNKWPVEEVAAVTKLRVCHAITKPRKASGRWNAPSIKAFRHKDKFACSAGSPPNGSASTILEPKLKNDIDATEVFLEGSVEIDLNQIDSFQIVAEAAGTDGRPMDQYDRGRSVISKRSGRWPKQLQRDGNLRYVGVEDVVGFGVDANGVVSLPRHPVTLLSVSNLPNHGAVGEILDLEDDDSEGGKNTCKPKMGFKQKPLDQTKVPGAPVFKAPSNGLTPIALAPLFAAASRQAKIHWRIGMQKDAIDVSERTLQLKIERPQAFNDTLARRLDLKLVGVSRFAAAFETTARYVNGSEQALNRRQPLKTVDQTVVIDNIEPVWLNSTKRPAAPDLKRPEPSFRITRSGITATTGAQTHKLERDAMTRLYFARGWFSSGEEERLGIVLWPPNYNTLKSDDIDQDKIYFKNRSLTLTNFEDADLGTAGAYITRWGGDPIRNDLSPQKGNFIPYQAFVDSDIAGEGPHQPAFFPNVLMPIPRAGSKDDDNAPPPEFLEVSLLTYLPCFDLDREQWYVDVNLKPIRASEPFVRFGLVRYQDHSISDDIKVSMPVSVQMQLLPHRTASVTVEPPKNANGANYKVTLEVKGLGSSNIDDILSGVLDKAQGKERSAWSDNFDLLRRPRVKFTLFHEAADESRGTMSTPITPIFTQPPPDYDEKEGMFILPMAQVVNLSLEWTIGFKLPAEQVRKYGPGRIVAYIEEVDLRMPASYRSEPIDLARMFDKTNFVESGPRFSARLPFINID